MNMGSSELWHCGIFTVTSVFKGHRLFLPGGQSFIGLVGSFSLLQVVALLRLVDVGLTLPYGGFGAVLSDTTLWWW